jgi:hypothetical protein
MKFFRLLLKDLLSLFRDDKELHLERFSFPEEIPTIMKIAEEYFSKGDIEYPVNPYALLFAIREAEKGRKGFEFGIISAKNTDLETQCRYACETIINNVKRFYQYLQEGERSALSERREDELCSRSVEGKPGFPLKYNDFITFLGSRYAPAGADNDPHNLNSHWVRNVKFFYNQFTGGN